MPVDEQSARHLATLLLAIEQASDLSQVRQVAGNLEQVAREHESKLLQRGKQSGYAEAVRELRQYTQVL